MTDVAQLGVHLEETGAEQVVAALNRVEAAVKGTHASTLQMGAAVGAASATMTAGFNAIASAAGAALGGVGDGLVGMNSKLEQSGIAFTTMLGSAEAAGAFLQQLQSFAATTPFEFPQLVDASKRMLAFGFTAEQIIPTLTAVGNAAAAMGSGKEGIDRITTALGQMQAKGKLQAEEMLQLTEAGIPAWDMLAKKLGTDVAGAMDLVTKKQVDAQTFMQAFTEGTAARFGNMMEAQSHTFAGAMSTIKDRMGQLVGGAFKPFFDILSGLADRLSQFAQTETVSIWAEDLKITLGALGPMFNTVAETLSGALPGAMSAAEAGAHGFVTGVQAIADAFTAVQGKGQEFLGAIQPVTDWFGQLDDQLGDVPGRIAADVGGMFDALGHQAEQFAAIWQGVMGALGGQGTSDTALSGLATGFHAVLDAAEAFGSTVGTAFQTVQIVAVDALNIVLPKLEELGTWVGETIQPKIAAMQEAWDGFWSHAGPLVQATWAAVQPILEMLGSILASEVVLALQAVKTTWDNVWSGFGEVLQNFVLPVLRAIGDVVGPWAGQLADNLTLALQGLQAPAVAVAAETGTQVRQAFVQGVAPIGAEVEQAAAPAAEAVKKVGVSAAAATSGLSSLGAAGTTAATGLGTAAKEAQTLDQVMAQLAKSTTPEAVQQALTYQNALAGISEASKNLDLGTAAQVTAMRNAGDVYGANRLALTALGATEEEATRVVYGYASAHDVLAEAAFRATGALREQQAAAAQGPGAAGVGAGGAFTGPTNFGPALGVPDNGRTGVSGPSGGASTLYGPDVLRYIQEHPENAQAGVYAPANLSGAAASQFALGNQWALLRDQMQIQAEAQAAETVAAKDHTAATQQGTNAALHGAAALSDFQTNIVSASDANAAMGDAFSHGGQKLVAFTAGTGLATNQVVLFGDATAEAAKVVWAAAVQQAQALREGTAVIAGFKTAVGLNTSQIYGNTATQGTGSGGGGTNQGIVNLNPGNYYGLPVVSPLTGGTLRGFANGGMVYEPSYIVPTRTGIPSAIMAERGPEAVGGGGSVNVQIVVQAGIGASDEVSARPFWNKVSQDHLVPILRSLGR